MSSTSFGIVFPGQGSQQVGMLAEVASVYPEVMKTFAEASEILGYDLWQLAQQGPAVVLGQTQVTQPLMLVAGVAVWRVWKKAKGADPIWMAGHSLGEYTALVCANALAFSDAVGLVEKRARYMNEAVAEGEGSMAAILGLSAQKIIELCEMAKNLGPVTPANFNTPEQTVIGGMKIAVERVAELAKMHGAKKVIPVAMSVPSHCPLMLPAAERLKADLAHVHFRSPNCLVINNVDVAAMTPISIGDDMLNNQIRDALFRQMYHPVRWVEVIQAAVGSGITRLIELGSGKVLSGLNKRIAPDIQSMSVQDITSLHQALEEFSL